MEMTFDRVVQSTLKSMLFLEIEINYDIFSHCSWHSPRLLSICKIEIWHFCLKNSAARVSKTCRHQHNNLTKKGLQKGFWMQSNSLKMSSKPGLKWIQNWNLILLFVNSAMQASKKVADISTMSWPKARL